MAKTPTVKHKQNRSSMMSRLFCLAIAILVSLPAYAGKTRADADSYRAAGSTGAYYGRSDGIYQDKNSKGLVAISNGTSGQLLGPTYFCPMTYAANTGMSQVAWSTGLTVAGLTTTVPALMTFADGCKLNWAAVVTETLYPVEASVALGLNISADLVNADGLEVWGGQLGASGRPFVVGTDPAFQFCVDANLLDVSEQTIFRIGFRAVADSSGVPDPMNAVFANYDTYATIGPNIGAITISTELDAAGITSTNTTDTATDGVSRNYCVKVSNTGVVTYTIDGAAPTVTAAVTLTSGYSVVPFVHYVHAAAIGVGDFIYLKNWNVSYTE
jgi:hypothetical protein